MSTRPTRCAPSRPRSSGREPSPTGKESLLGSGSFGGGNSMTRVSRALVRAILAISAIGISVPAGHAAGAMAVGQCAAFGYAADYSNAEAARAAAQGKCVGRDCKVVMMLKRSCAALAIDGRKPCGPHGYASARELGEA